MLPAVELEEIRGEVNELTMEPADNDTFVEDIVTGLDVEELVAETTTELDAVEVEEICAQYPDRIVARLSVVPQGVTIASSFDKASG